MFDSLRPLDCSTPGFSVLHYLISQSLLKLMSTELVVLSNHFILLCPVLLLPSTFTSIGVFRMSWLLASGGQSIGASVSVLSMNIQSWFPLGWTGLIFLLSKGFSRVFSNTTDLLAVQGTFKSLLQHHNSKASVLWHSAFFMVNSHMHTWLLEKP